MSELVRWDATPADPIENIRRIEEWVDELLGMDLVAEFAGDSSEFESLGLVAKLEALDHFATLNWDFRAGRERNLALEPNFTKAQSAAIDSAAARLWLDGTPTPRKKKYDSAIMTGGMVRAGIVKPRFLVELSDSGIEFGEAVFLGASRAFAGDEVALSERLGVDGDNEIDAMRTGMTQAFGLGTPTEHRSGGTGFGYWEETEWQHGQQMFRVIAAPSSDPALRRANTLDTFRYLAGSIDPASKSILVVTTPVYVPYQAAMAVIAFGLERGCCVETVAVSDSANDLGLDTQIFGQQHKLQELRSAIHGYRILIGELLSGR